MNFTRDLDKDIIVHKMGLFSVKRYSYTKMNYVDSEGKTINEPVYSFILMRGQKWFNSTHLNFRESELDNVIPAYEKILSNMQEERRDKLTLERSLRKKFPIKHEFIFENVTIVAIERPCYYWNGIPSTSGSYFEPKEKIVNFYANGKPYRKSVNVNIDTVVDADFVLINTINNEIMHNYSVNKFNESFYKIITKKFDFSYIPLIAIIGYAYELNGEVYEFLNFRYSMGKYVFETQKEDQFDVSLYDLMKQGKPVYELGGFKAWRALLNKAKFV